jgi:predicted dehydrogenase
MASQSITGAHPDLSTRGWFADSAQSGGPVLDLAIHSFDYLLWLFQDRVIRVSAVGVREKIAVHGYALVTLRFANGGIGLVEVSWLHPRRQGLLVRNELLGTEGRLSWDYDAIAALQVVKDDGRQNHTMVPGGWDVQSEGFVRSIRGGARPWFPGERRLRRCASGWPRWSRWKPGRR